MEGLTKMENGCWYTSVFIKDILGEEEFHVWSTLSVLRPARVRIYQTCYYSREESGRQFLEDIKRDSKGNS